MRTRSRAALWASVVVIGAIVAFAATKYGTEAPAPQVTTTAAVVGDIDDAVLST